jgi:hypothetical protein
MTFIRSEAERHKYSQTENLKAINIIKIQVGKKMEKHVIIGGQIEVYRRIHLEELRKNKKILSQDCRHRGRDANRILPQH